MAGDFVDWYYSVPQISRYWFTCSVVLPLLGKIGILNIAYMYLDYTEIVTNFQIWRPITALFYYPIMPQTGFHYLMNLYFLYSYSTRLELGTFTGRPADYLFMLLFNWLSLVVIGLFTTLPFLMDPMILSVLYIWCQLNKDTIVSFWFGTQFKAMYLPWVLVGFNIIIQGAGPKELIGIVVGHFYFFLMFKYPQDFGGSNFLSTPSLLYKYFPNIIGGQSGMSGRFGPSPVRPERPDRPAFGGSGHRLGD